MNCKQKNSFVSINQLSIQYQSATTQTNLHFVSKLKSHPELVSGPKKPS
jgi:hypothetical protein